MMFAVSRLIWTENVIRGKVMGKTRLTTRSMILDKRERLEIGR